jgi:hypothetical protein
MRIIDADAYFIACLIPREGEKSQRTDMVWFEASDHSSFQYPPQHVNWILIEIARISTER